jgi:hypothetical protein
LGGFHAGIFPEVKRELKESGGTQTSTTVRSQDQEGGRGREWGRGGEAEYTCGAGGLWGRAAAETDPGSRADGKKHGSHDQSLSGDSQWLGSTRR